jgi:hypothetical protein
MAITLAGNIGMNIPYPMEGNEIFWENFANLLDGNAVTLTSGASAVAAPVTLGKVFSVNGMGALAGTTFTLPGATGTGMRIMFYVSVLATSNSHIIKTSPSTDIFQGMILGARTDSTNVVLGFAGQSNSNTITLNRTATGSVNIGEHVEVMDVAAGVWLVRGMLSATGGSFTTPFSHV